MHAQRPLPCFAFACCAATPLLPVLTSTDAAAPVLASLLVGSTHEALGRGCSVLTQCHLMFPLHLVLVVQPAVTHRGQPQVLQALLLDVCQHRRCKPLGRRVPNAGVAANAVHAPQRVSAALPTAQHTHVLSKE